MPEIANLGRCGEMHQSPTAGKMQKTLYPSRSGGMPGPVSSHQIGWALRPQRPSSPPLRGFFRRLVPRRLQNPLRFSAVHGSFVAHASAADAPAGSATAALALLCTAMEGTRGPFVVYALSVLRPHWSMYKPAGHLPNRFSPTT